MNKLRSHLQEFVNTQLSWSEIKVSLLLSAVFFAGLANWAYEAARHWVSGYAAYSTLSVVTFIPFLVSGLLLIAPIHFVTRRLGFQTGHAWRPVLRTWLAFPTLLFLLMPSPVSFTTALVVLLPINVLGGALYLFNKSTAFRHAFVVTFGVIAALATTAAFLGVLNVAAHDLRFFF